MYNYTMNAPDIRYSALQAEKKDKKEYNLEDLRQAVTHGKHPDGSNLDRYMPRWEIEDGDLADVLDYLKSLP